MNNVDSEWSSSRINELNVDWSFVDVERLDWKDSAKNTDWKSDELHDERSEIPSGAEAQREIQEKFEELLGARSAECLDLIRHPDPEESHQITCKFEAVREAVFSYVDHGDDGDLTVSEFRDPSSDGVEELHTLPYLLSCTCGAKNMSWEEAIEHMSMAQNSE